MTPVYLKTPSSLCPPVEKMEEEYLKLFDSPDQASSSLLSAAFLDRTQDGRGSVFEKSQEHAEKMKLNILWLDFWADTPLPNGSYDHQELSVPSNHYVEEDGHNLQKVSLCHKVDEERSRTTNGSVQWMSSKMRLMKKVMNPNRPDADQSVRIMQNFQNIQQHGDCKINSPINSNNSTRVCADCNTTTTPLWRSGPRGPKSLCNACGIRQRKARRAMAEAAANGLVVATDISSTKNKVHSKEKKSRTIHFGQHRIKGKVSDSSSHNERKLSFKDFALSLRNSPDFGRVLPEDVAEAAILLMELSCGLVHG